MLYIFNKCWYKVSDQIEERLQQLCRENSANFNFFSQEQL